MWQQQGNRKKKEDLFLKLLMYVLKTNKLRVILIRQNEDIRTFHISRNIKATQVIIRPSSRGIGEDELQQLLYLLQHYHAIGLKLFES